MFQSDPYDSLKRFNLLPMPEMKIIGKIVIKSKYDDM